MWPENPSNNFLNDEKWEYLFWQLSGISCLSIFKNHYLKHISSRRIIFVQSSPFEGQFIGCIAQWLKCYSPALEMRQRRGLYNVQGFYTSVTFAVCRWKHKCQDFLNHSLFKSLKQKSNYYYLEIIMYSFLVALISGLTLIIIHRFFFMGFIFFLILFSFVYFGSLAFDK